MAHDTKAARDAQRRGDAPGSGVVAGSAAWYDGARGVLSLMQDPDEASNDRLLECVKANYGRTGWGARLSERSGDNGTFRGLRLATDLDRAALSAAKNPPNPNNRSGSRRRKDSDRKRETTAPSDQPWEPVVG